MGHCLFGLNGAQKRDAAGSFLPFWLPRHYQHSFIPRLLFRFMVRLFETLRRVSKTMLRYRNSKWRAEWLPSSSQRAPLFFESQTDFY